MEEQPCKTAKPGFFPTELVFSAMKSNAVSQTKQGLWADKQTSRWRRTEVYQSFPAPLTPKESVSSCPCKRPE